MSGDERRLVEGLLVGGLAVFLGWRSWSFLLLRGRKLGEDGLGLNNLGWLSRNWLLVVDRASAVGSGTGWARLVLRVSGRLRATSRLLNLKACRVRVIFVCGNSWDTW